MTPTTNPVPGRTPDDHEAPVNAGAYLYPKEGVMTIGDYPWVAECAGCSWSARTESLREADLKADLHAAVTGHETDVDQAE
jgi:hypothetical protein